MLVTKGVRDAIVSASRSVDGFRLVVTILQLGTTNVQIGNHAFLTNATRLESGSGGGPHLSEYARKRLLDARSRLLTLWS